MMTAALEVVMLSFRRVPAALLSAGLLIAIVALVAAQDGRAVGGNDSLVIAEAGDVGYYASMVAGANGDPIVAHYRNAGGDDARLLNCGNTGCSSGNASSTLAVGVTGYVTLDLDAGGNPAVAYRSSVPSLGLSIVRCGDPQCSIPTVTSTLMSGVVPRSLELDSSDNPIIVIDGVSVIHCDDPNCAGQNESVTTPAVGAEASMVVDTTGNPVIAFVAPNGELGVLHCIDADCSLAGSVAFPDIGNTAQHPALVLDSAGNPVVTYRDGTSYDLKVLRCGDPDCGSSNTIAAPDPGYVVASSVAIDQSNNPAIAYYEASSLTALKLLRCGNPDCSSGNTIRVIDNLGDVGQYPSLLLDSLDYPTIAYQQDAGPFAHELRVVHCASPACDVDDDGCSDPVEGQTAAGSELFGGRRSTKNAYDYFNPTGDGQNRVDDVLAIVNQYFMDDSDGNPGLPPFAPGYDPAFDRTLIGPDAWDTGPPNGLQRVDDILNMVNQYFHDCG